MNNDVLTLLLAIGSLIVTPILFVLILVITDKYFKKFDNK
jgi:hypothetical protein